MTTILTDLSKPALVQAIEDSSDEAFACFVRDVPNVDLRDTPEMFRYASGIPFFLANGVVRTRLNSEGADDVIDETLSYFQSRKLPMMWMVGPQTRPIDMADRLTAHGLIPLDIMPGMAIDLNQLPDLPTLPQNITLEEVGDMDTLDEWTQTLSTGYGVPLNVAEAFVFASKQMGFGEHLPLRNFLARQDGRPVACSTLFLGAGVAGIYCVATVEEARRQGLGAAVTTMPLKIARAMGYRVGVLQASQMGHPVYRRIGFEELCSLTLYARFNSEES